MLRSNQLPLVREILLLPVLLTACLMCVMGDVGAQSDSADEPVLTTERFEFEVDGNRLVGLYDRPVGRDPMATILIVHGYGRTHVVEYNWYYTLRSLFAEAGIATLIWDKPGCGESEGEFDINQPVESSAEEVVAAIHALRGQVSAGQETIGLWGISRAGWISPLAMQKEPSISFWISVSGTDDKENGRYLLEENFPIEGRSKEEAEMLVSEWQVQFDTFWKGGTYEEYLAAAPNLSKDEFMEFMGWGGTVSEQEFLDYQAKFESGELVVDEDEGLMVYVPGFRDVLGSINAPVLALFGEKDTQVDWRKTAMLYEETIGMNPKASLEITVFPDANHILKQCDACGVRETNSLPWDAPFAEGYYESMVSWLERHGFGERVDAE